MLWIALAGALGLALSAGILAAGARDDLSTLQADAMAALGTRDGDCIQAAHIVKAGPDLAALRDKAEQLGGRPGRGDGIFVRGEADLAADLSGKVVASGSSVVWVLTETPGNGQRAVTQYSRIDLGEARTAWVSGTSIRTIPCSEAGEG